MVSSISKIGLLVIALILGGCIVKPDLPTDQPLQEAQTHFHIEGKLGIRTIDISESARFIWSQTSKQYQLALHDPFGRQVMRLNGSPEQTLLEIEEKRFNTNSIEKLMTELLGWQVPVTQMPFWIQGHPAPNEESHRINKNQFKQAGWMISVLKNSKLPTREIVPYKLKMQHPKLTLTFITSSWSFPNK